MELMRPMRVGDRKEAGGQSPSYDNGVALRVLAEGEPGNCRGFVMDQVVVRWKLQCAESSSAKGRLELRCPRQLCGWW